MGWIITGLDVTLRNSINWFDIINPDLFFLYFSNKVIIEGDQ
jgi:hypothetical protein